jgi:hypothetical protein
MPATVPVQAEVGGLAAPAGTAAQEAVPTTHVTSALAPARQLANAKRRGPAASILFVPFVLTLIGLTLPTLP